MKETIKDTIWAFCFTFFVTVVVIALLILGAWLDASATGTEVIIHKEKIVTCEPAGKGWSKCNTTWI